MGRKITMQFILTIELGGNVRMTTGAELADAIGRVGFDVNAFYGDRTIDQTVDGRAEDDEAIEVGKWEIREADTTVKPVNTRLLELARLCDEARAVITISQVEEMAQSMDLKPMEVEELFTEAEAIFESAKPKPEANFTIDGTTEDGFTLNGDGKNPPFAIFNVAAQAWLPTHYESRQEAERALAADLLARQPVGAKAIDASIARHEAEKALHTYAAIHTHRYGTSFYLVRAAVEPTEAELIDACNIEFESDRDEGIEIELIDEIRTVEAGKVIGYTRLEN
jgi:hypothetical protein